MIKNKKGFVWLPVIIIGGLALLGIGAGWYAKYKIEHIFSSIPTWFWIVLLIFLFFILMRRKKK